MRKGTVRRRRPFIAELGVMETSIQDWGAIGEIIGGLAVIGTLVYLSVQTKQTRIAAEQTAKFAASEATHSAEGGYARWRSSITNNTEVAKIVAKARSDESLEEWEQIIFSQTFDQLFFTAAVSYLSSSGSASVHESSADVEHLVEDLGANPHAVEDWRRCSLRLKLVAPDLLSTVNQRLGLVTDMDEDQCS